jgi:hypothetical protein
MSFRLSLWAKIFMKHFKLTFFTIFDQNQFSLGKFCQNNSRQQHEISNEFMPVFSYKSIVSAEAKFAIWVDFLKLNYKTTMGCSWTSKSLLMNGKIFELPTI